MEELEKTDRIVAVAGVHPFIKALENGRGRDYRGEKQ